MRKNSPTLNQKPEKLDKKTLSYLNELNEKHGVFKDRLAEMELQYQSISQAKWEIFKAIEANKAEFQEATKVIKEKYGNVNVNLKTGVITKNDLQKEEDVKEKEASK